MEKDRHSYLTHLDCPECGDFFEDSRLQTFCENCSSPLLARYGLAGAATQLNRAQIANRPGGMWRWHELLPVRDPTLITSLGEGDSPLLKLERLGSEIGIENLYLKDDSGQPTGTFKSRGLAMAVSKAIELGVKEFVIPTAGNAGGALAAYAAKAGKPAHVYMPQDAPPINIAEVRALGADLHLVDGLISDAGALAGQAAREHGWFDVSTMKEPYRLEGKKTMGLEMAQDFAWELPDVIIYPTGGGTGLVGMWKAFQELGQMGWIGDHRPRMVAVQTTGCAPIVKAFEQGSDKATFWEGAETIASGLRVPHAFGHRLILRTLYESGGNAVAVTDEDLIEAQKLLARQEGVFAAPEGAATVVAAKLLHESGWIQPAEQVVLYNTGTGLKYL